MGRVTIGRMLCAAGLAAMAGACGDAGPSGDAQLAVNLAIGPRPSVPLAALAAVVAPETYTDGAGNSLTFDRVQIVLREVELENEVLEDGCESTSGDDSSDCAEVEIGPLLVELPLGAPGASRVFTATVPAGTYDEVEFEIHQPDGDLEDQAFLAENPDFADVSIRVEGSYNGTPFTFTSDVNAKLELELATPLVIDGLATTDLTLLVNLDAWFRDNDGNLLDPATADSSLVANNVQRSFTAFEDDDHSG